MFAVSKKLLKVMLQFVKQEEIGQGLERAFTKFATVCQGEKQLLFELLGSSLRTICKGDSIQFTRKAL